MPKCLLASSLARATFFPFLPIGFMRDTGLTTPFQMISSMKMESWLGRWGFRSIMIRRQNGWRGFWNNFMWDLKRWSPSETVWVISICLKWLDSPLLSTPLAKILTKSLPSASKVGIWLISFLNYLFDANSRPTPNLDLSLSLNLRYPLIFYLLMKFCANIL